MCSRPNPYSSLGQVNLTLRRLGWGEVRIWAEGLEERDQKKRKGKNLLLCMCVGWGAATESRRENYSFSLKHCIKEGTDL